jgi:hypothetical protein
MITALFYPLILAFSRREKGFSFVLTGDSLCPAFHYPCNPLYIVLLDFNTTKQDSNDKNRLLYVPGQSAPVLYAFPAVDS